jgi:hypothetical protein
MDCYSISNPTNGQKCNDDQLGALVFNSSDVTWEKQTGYTKDANGFSFNLDSLPGTASTGKTFVQQYGMYLLAAGVFVVVLVILSATAKKK